MGNTSDGVGEKQVRVLLGKSMIDAHDRGLKYIAKKFQQAGMEVVLSSFETAEELANMAVQEDVNVIGFSSLGGGYFAIISDLMKLLKSNETMKDVLVILGGIIPSANVAKLLELGVGGVFGPGTRPEEIIKFILRRIENQHPLRFQER